MLPTPELPKRGQPALRRGGWERVGGSGHTARQPHHGNVRRKLPAHTEGEVRTVWGKLLFL